MKRYFIEEIDNMRDLGGYAINNYEFVKNNLLIRSNVPTKLSERTLEQLKRMDISTVIDLRDDEEIIKKKGIFIEKNLFDYNHVTVNGNGRIPLNKEGVLSSYIEMLEGKNEIKQVFNIIANAKGGIIYYCDAGKDRTGVISALILKLLGVRSEDIIIDYIASGIFLNKMLKSFAESMKNTQDIYEIIKPNEKTMSDLLTYICDKYNSVEAYLKNCGLSQSYLDKIKSKYIESIGINL